MDKQKLETKLEQVQIKRDAIFADIESLRSNEQDADKEIISIKAEIEALDKPELRHGDYGTENDGQRWIVLRRDGQLEVFGDKSGSGIIVKVSWPSCKCKLGNIFDDTKVTFEAKGSK